MKKSVYFLLITPFLFVGISGCAPLIVGGVVGAAGVYAVSQDAIEGETDKPYDSLWDTALMIARARGVIKQEDSLKGYIMLEEKPSKVYIHLIKVTQSTTRLRVAARKHHLPNIELAQGIFTKIIDQAK